MFRNRTDRTLQRAGSFSLLGAATALIGGYIVLVLMAPSASAQIDPPPPPPEMLVCVEQVVGPVAELAGYDAADITVEVATPAGVLTTQNFGAGTEICGPNGDFEGAPDGALGYVSAVVLSGDPFTLTTVMPDDKIGPVDVTCLGDGDPIQQNGPDAIAIEVETNVGDDLIRCTFRTNSVNICIAKTVGPQAYDGGARPVDASFELRIGETVEAAPAYTAVPPDVCDEYTYDEGQPLDSAAFTEFLVAPDQEVTIAELLPADGSLGVVFNECFFMEEPAEIGPPIIDDGDDTTVQAYVSVDVGPLFCDFVNDGVIVCVSKILTPTALEALGPDVRARDFDFTVTLRDGTPLTTLDGQEEMTRRPSDLCRGVVDQPEAPGRALRYGQFLLAHGTRFTIAETGPDGVARLVGPSSADCSQDNLVPELIEQPQAFALEDGTEVLVERVEPGPIIGSTNGRARRNRPPVACEFVNNAVRVCVSNYLGFIADEAGLRARDFDIAATLRDGTPLVTLDGQADMGNTPPDGCVVPTPGLTPGGRAERHGQFFVAPGTRFRVTETVPNDTAIPVLSGCGLEPFDVQQDTSLSVNGRGSAQVIYCSFFNDSARVCVATQILRTALDAPNNFLARDYDFDIAERNGTVLVHLDGQLDMSRNPQGQCPAVGDGPNRAFRYGTAYVAPGTDFRIVQTDIAGPIDPVASVCGNDFDDGFILERAEPGDVIVLPPAPATADGSVPPFIGPSTGCTFLNDSSRVCVSKHVRATARDAGFVATDFSFDLMTRDGESLGSVAGADLTAEPTGECDADVDRNGPASAWGFHEFFVAPDQRITMNETGAADAAVGPVRSRCRQNQGQEEEDDFPPPPPFVIPNDFGAQRVEAETAILGSANGRARYRRGPVFCEFANNSVRVCVVKTMGTNAIDQGSLASDFAVTLGYGMTTTAAGNPVAVAEKCGEAADGAASGYVEFFAPPNVPFVVSETIPVDTPVALVNRACSQGEVDVTGLPTGIPNTVAGTGSAGNTPVLCVLVNDAVRVCVAKSVGATAVEAGVVAADAVIDLMADNVVIGSGTPNVATEGCAAAPTGATTGHVEFFVAPGSTFGLSETLPEGSLAGLVAAACDGVAGDPVATPAVTHTAAASEATTVICTLENDSIRVTVDKELINDGEPSEFTSVIGDFTFEVFDGSGAMLLSGVDTDPSAATGFEFFAAPNQTLTVNELARIGYDVTAASCTVGDVVGPEAAAPSVSLVLPAAATTASCLFVNNDIPLIPICATQQLLPGLTDFVLDDLGIELFTSGELIASKTGAAAGDPRCGSVVAAASPERAGVQQTGNQILLARVLPGPTPYTMVQTFPAAAGARLQSIQLDCVLVGAGSAQALTAAQAVFTPSATTSRVDCRLSAQAVPIPATVSVAVVGPGPLSPADISLSVTSAASGAVVLEGVGPLLTVADLRSGLYNVVLAESPNYILRSVVCDGLPVANFTIVDTNVAGSQCELVVESLDRVPLTRGVSPVVDLEAEPVAAKVAVPAAATGVATDVISLSTLATTGGSATAALSIGFGFLAVGAGLAGAARTRRRRT